MAKETKLSIAGTSFHGITITTTPQKLIDLFPNTYYEGNSGQNKTNFDFTLENEEGKVFTIYDWKEYRPLEMDEMIIWHIGGKCKEDCIVSRDELVKML